MSLLAATGALLAPGLEFEGTLERVVGLPVPMIADACVLQLVDAGPRRAPAQAAEPHFEHLWLMHADAEVERRVRAQCGGASTSLQRTFGALEVLRTGRAQVVPDLSREFAGDAPCLMRELAARRYVSLPLSVHGQTLGVWTLIISERSRAKHPELLSDAKLLSELASRASIAVDSARLYRDAKRATAIRDDVLAVVSHDLQSPLNAISMTVKRLSLDAQLAEIAGAPRALTLIERTTKHVAQLIAELLEVGNIQAGRLELNRSATDLARTIHEALAMLEPLVQDKRLQVSTQIEPRLPRARCDGERILRVLMNLLDNAIKFSSEDGELTVRARVVDDHLEVSIRDTGPGITREDLPKLFEPYWRSRHAGRRGMGLGLYIARGIIEAHGGHIWAESELGAGSTFFFRLAIAPAELT